MIPLSIPHLSGNELKYVTECIETGWVSSAGSYVTKFEEMVAKWAGCKYGIAASSGTSGLHLAMHMLGIEHGDIVLVPNITFIASANAVAYTNATPVFIDIDPETWQMDLDLLEEWLDENNSPSVKAVMPVHVLGNMCDMEKLLDIAYRHGLRVIEDSTEALGSYYKGKSAGSFGEMNVFSFNGNKIITTGGGGVIVTNDEAHAKRAKHLSTQSKVDPETYFHDEIGFNYRLVNVLAAIGVAQMEQLPSFILKKKEIDAFYRTNLKDVGDIRFQKVEDNVDPNCWLFTFQSSQQVEILKALKENEIIARPFWYPMNQLPMFKENIYHHHSDYSRRIHANCLSIPSSVNLGESELTKVVEVIKNCF
ncbi:LegC family aminotransferase [Portibacter lacus]|uniref:GDP-perosamine synthase n=1 Tax=Portibacter lacus TaxID=1099794 RepID=A0AA37SQ44_9BACT|nr:LegC family aminotransferase [Portibacter lacus]GLR18871.1 aminotransferase DegT [Portibacter lacus]